MPRTKPKHSQANNAAPPAPAVQARPEEPNEVLTLAEAAAYLRLPAADVVRLVRERRLPGQGVGDDWRFLKSAIQDWLRFPQVLPTKQAFWETHFGVLKDDPYLEEMLKQGYQGRGRPETDWSRAP